MFNSKLRHRNALLEDEVRVLEMKLAKAEEMIRTLNDSFAKREEELLRQIGKTNNQ